MWNCFTGISCAVTWIFPRRFLDADIYSAPDLGCPFSPATTHTVYAVLVLADIAKSSRCVAQLGSWRRVLMFCLFPFLSSKMPLVVPFSPSLSSSDRFLPWNINLKMRCEFLEGENTCKRCKSSGNPCVVEGRKPRNAPK